MTQNKEILQNLKLLAFHLSEPQRNYQLLKEYKTHPLNLATFSPKSLNLNRPCPKFRLRTFLRLVNILILWIVRKPPPLKGEVMKTVSFLTIAWQLSSRRTSRNLLVRLSSKRTPSRPRGAALRWSVAFSCRRSGTRSTTWGSPAMHGGSSRRLAMKAGLFRILQG